MQAFELIILAVLAAVVLFQLYAVLGRKVGRGPDETARVSTGTESVRGPRVAAPAGAENVQGTGLAALRARDPAFDVSHFLQGADQAYQMIVKAFASGDRATLQPLLAPAVMDGFEAAIRERESQARSESVEFLHPPRADLERIDLIGDLVKASVRFLAEFRSRSKGPEGEGVDDRRTAEIWTFERNLKSRDPNWRLIHVDAAEA